MKTLLLYLYTQEDVSKRECANNILKILSELNILPDKIGKNEPIKENYSLDEALRLWETGRGSNDCIRGGLCAKRKEPRIDYNFVWHKGKLASMNYFSIMCHGRKAFRDIDKVIDLFKKLVNAVNAVYGYISDYDVRSRQFIPGTIESKLPGVFWCNYFGSIYLDFLSKDRLLKLEWTKIEEEDGGGYFFLADFPDSSILLQDHREKEFRDKIGIEYFGKSEIYNENVNIVEQDTKAPSFDLSKLYS